MGTGFNNTLYYGDNLHVLREHIKDETVDLVYLDPPFKSNQNYNVLFKEQDGTRAASQIQAFEDTWRWDQAAAAAFEDAVTKGPERVSLAMQAFRMMLGTSDMLAYLAMMATRLVEMRRVLKSTGSIYLHCDPTASHYLKVIMDAVFGPRAFMNEIIWKRTVPKSDYKQGAVNWPRVHDSLLMYSKDQSAKPHFEQQFSAFSEEYVASSYPYRDDNGRAYGLHSLTAPGRGMRGHPQYEFLGVTRYWRYGQQKMEQLLAEGRVVQKKPGLVPRYKRYFDEVLGVPVGDVWVDIGMIQGQSKEFLGYPTQKPETLLERIILASSNEGEVVLDPFCGCGTAVAVAQRLNRHWIGIDITHLAVTLMKQRLRDSFGIEAGKDYTVIGEPQDLASARQLANEDAYQFQWWALGLVRAVPREKKKGSDAGIDGRLTWSEDAYKAKTAELLISVKSGKVGVDHIRDLRGTIEREGAAIGAYITLNEPTQPMRAEAAAAGFYEAWGKKFPRIQILTIGDLLAGATIQYPGGATANITYRRAPKAKDKGKKTGELPL